eukprot:CAMPEP_0170583230 /NCGR_PEP_ID=MMETSP0224-20130122/8016_1 /TAXON_ID=285029 /ORGANISM="Togula jolla, Strain CCCM 725" /LENGTH=82 /DNA_ID=CAMNT_0010906527 /DNA_START=267 /DNA_END=515 /DNA_ORIENTATION=-
MRLTISCVYARTAESGEAPQLMESTASGRISAQRATNRPGSIGSSSAPGPARTSAFSQTCPPNARRVHRADSLHHIPEGIGE